MGKKLPWFPFWVDDFLSDENVLVMSNEEVGIYVKLLCHQWKAGSIPAMLLPMAKLCGTNGDEMAGHWQQIGKCFREVADNPDRLVNPRLELEREQQRTLRKARSDAGLLGAEAKWRGHGKAKILPLAKNGKPESEPELELEVGTTPPKAPQGGASKTKSKGKKTQGTPTPAPADFKPTTASLEWLRGKYGEIPERETEHQTEQFLQHHLKVGKFFVDWQAAWKTWMNNWKTDFGRNVPQGETPQGGGARPWEANGDPNLIRHKEDEPPPVP